MKLAITTLAALALALPALAQEENMMKMEDAPAAAMDAAKANANGVEFETVQMDPDGETDTYEFAGKLESGMAYEVDVLADGTIEEIEEQIEMDAVPEAVKSALEAEMAGFEPEFIEMSTREDGALIVYEFEGMHEEQEVDVEINEDGSNFMMNEDTEA